MNTFPDETVNYTRSSDDIIFSCNYYTVGREVNHMHIRLDGRTIKV